MQTLDSSILATITGGQNAPGYSPYEQQLADEASRSCYQSGSGGPYGMMCAFSGSDAVNRYRDQQKLSLEMTNRMLESINNGPNGLGHGLQRKH